MANPKLLEIANLITSRNGLPADMAQMLAAQMAHETGDLASVAAPHNYAGLSTMSETGYARPSDEGGYYKAYNSDEEFADDYYKGYVKPYIKDLIAVRNDPMATAQVLKNNGYYTDTVENYGGGLSRFYKEFGGISVPYQMYNTQGSPSQSFNTQLRMDNPNEPLDVKGMISAMNLPYVNGAKRQEQALSRELGYQTDLIGAVGSDVFERFSGQANQLAKAAMETAQEGANLENQQHKLTGVGKLAQMIANSNNSSNSKMYAAMGQMLGVNLNPMDDRYINSQKMALDQMQRNQAIQDEQRKMQQQKELSDYKMQQEIAAKKELATWEGEHNFELAKKYAEAGVSQKGKGGSSGDLTTSQKVKMNNDIIKLGDNYRKLYQETADKVYAGLVSEDALRQISMDAANQLASYDGLGLDAYKTVEGMIAGDAAYTEKQLLNLYGAKKEDGTRPNAYVGWK